MRWLDFKQAAFNIANKKTNYLLNCSIKKVTPA